ncbi:unnamed protein product [Chrysodeixis includens]|uniref:Uncharacterized protein n=1 Tax=Chrysodeixis includens TaxID=689277 RepID=A0A9P0BLH6_CHRIL|nr:unnamed protein product [Chrysodeixis includens]
MATTNGANTDTSMFRCCCSGVVFWFCKETKSLYNYMIFDIVAAVPYLSSASFFIKVMTCQFLSKNFPAWHEGNLLYWRYYYNTIIIHTNKLYSVRFPIFCVALCIYNIIILMLI